MKDLALKLLTPTPRALVVFGGISALALAVAFAAQFSGLAPCVLCIYQRWPYAVVVLLAAFGLFGTSKFPKAPAVALTLTPFVFAVNAVFAFYPTGVERHWWKSFLEGCAVPEIKGNITDVLAQIEAAPVVRCDEIPWTDPVLGLSMANYNVVLCLVLAIAAFWALAKNKGLK